MTDKNDSGMPEPRIDDFSFFEPREPMRQARRKIMTERSRPRFQNRTVAVKHRAKTYVCPHCGNDITYTVEEIVKRRTEG